VAALHTDDLLNTIITDTTDAATADTVAITTGYYTGEFLATTPGIGHSTAFPLANGLRHGKGTRVWASGNRYEGNNSLTKSLVLYRMHAGFFPVAAEVQFTHAVLHYSVTFDHYIAADVSTCLTLPRGSAA
jgi:MORN repeat